jgi:hypothetical protein
MADHACPRCKAHDVAVPTEVQLRQLISEDEGLESDAFVPLAGTTDQAVALAAFAHGLKLMISAFGIEIAGARLRRSLAVISSFARLARVFRRIDEARAPIEAEVRARYDRGEIGPSQANEIARATPTPEYDGRDIDDAWLKRVTGEGVDAL